MVHPKPGDSVRVLPSPGVDDYLVGCVGMVRSVRKQTLFCEVAFTLPHLSAEEVWWFPYSRLDFGPVNGGEHDEH